mgnify:FL=1
MALTKVTGQVIKDTTDITVGVLTVTNTLAVGGTVSIGGTLTYEDVTNVDAVGIITARSNILVGSGITLSPDGDVFATGISTFSEGFAGDVLIDDKIVHRGDTNTAIRFADTNTITAETSGSERLRIASNGNLIHTSLNKTLSLVSTQNASLAGTKIAFFGADRYDTDEEFAAIKGFLVGNNGGSGNKQNGKLQFVVGSASSTHTMDQNGKVGLNTDTPRSRLHVFSDRSGFGSGGVYGDLVVENSDDSTIQLLAPSTQSTNIHFGDENNGMVGRIGYAHTDNSMRFTTGNAEKARINSDGRLLIGIQAARSIAGGTDDLLQVESSGGGAGISVIRNSNNTSPPTLDLGKSRGYPNTIVQSGDKLGIISFAGADGTDLATVGAQITGEVDGTPGENDMPGRLVFKVTADGSSSPSTAMTIKNDGDVGIGVDSPDRKLHVGGSFIRVDDGYGLDTSGSTEKIILDDGFITFSTGAGTEAVRINSSQQLLFKNGSASTPGLAFISNTDTGFWSNSDNNFYAAIDGTTRFRFNLSYFGPGINDAYDLGNQSYKWDDVRATNGSIATSDRNEKNTIVASDLGLDFVNKLTPVSFKFNGKTRTHYGLIAQDIETVLADIGKSTTNFAGFIKDTVDDDGNPFDLARYGLRYQEFISPMIKAIQELSAENSALKARVAALEG